MRVLLIRHGRSAHLETREWVSAAGVQKWLTDYDEAGLADDDEPPTSLADEIAPAEFLVASDLPRAVASAERLAAGRPVVQSPLLRETIVDVPDWLPWRWPASVWATCINLHLGYRALRGVEAPPQEVRRAATASRWLTKLADEESPLVVVTHGLFRRLLADRLVASGWRPDDRWRSYRHWSAWSFRANGKG